MYTIVDKIDARFPDESIVKTNVIEELILVQDTRDKDILWGLLLIKDNEIKDNQLNDRVVFIKAGNMSFNSHHGGGMDALRTLRNWLNQNKITKRRLQFTGSEINKPIFIGQKISKNIFSNNSSSNNNVINQFNDWDSGQADW